MVFSAIYLYIFSNNTFNKIYGLATKFKLTNYVTNANKTFKAKITCKGHNNLKRENVTKC